VILSKHEGATATEIASKDPEDMSFAIPPQGVLTVPKMFLGFLCDLCGESKPLSGASPTTGLNIRVVGQFEINYTHH